MNLVVEFAAVKLWMDVVVLLVVVLLGVLHLPAASCRRRRCGASKEAPLPVSVVVRGNYPLVEYPELAVLSPSVTVA